MIRTYLEQLVLLAVGVVILGAFLAAVAAYLFVLATVAGFIAVLACVFPTIRQAAARVNRQFLESRGIYPDYDPARYALYTLALWTAGVLVTLTLAGIFLDAVRLLPLSDGSLAEAVLSLGLLIGLPFSAAVACADPQASPHAAGKRALTTLMTIVRQKFGI